MVQGLLAPYSRFVGGRRLCSARIDLKQSRLALGRVCPKQVCLCQDARAPRETPQTTAMGIGQPVLRTGEADAPGDFSETTMGQLRLFLARYDVHVVTCQWNPPVCWESSARQSDCKSHVVCFRLDCINT